MTQAVNPHRGEFALSNDYVLRFTLSGLAAYDGAFSDPAQMIWARINHLYTVGGTFTVNELLGLLRAGLRERHGDLAADGIDQAVIDAGGLVAAHGIVVAALTETFGIKLVPADEASDPAEAAAGLDYDALHAQYIEAGFNPNTFWDLTPLELNRHFRAAAARLRREHSERLWLAWHIAALGRTDRLPALADLQAGNDTEKRRANQARRNVEAMRRLAASLPATEGQSQ